MAYLSLHKRKQCCLWPSDHTYTDTVMYLSPVDGRDVGLQTSDYHGLHDYYPGLRTAGAEQNTRVQNVEVPYPE